MKKIPRFVVAGLIIGALLATLAIAYAVSDNFLLGGLFNKNSEQGNNETIVEFKGIAITAADIEREIKINDLTNSVEKKSETDVVNDLILKQIYLSEAEKLGLQATSEEISALVNEQKKFYEEFEEITSMVDEYCKGASMTLEEYWIDLEERAPRVIARNKVYNNFFDEYCEKNGLDKYSSRTQEEINNFNAEYQKYRETLLTEYGEYIVYHDVDKIASDNVE